MTPIVCAEPMKKKKKLDPQIVKARLDRRKRKIEKQIRRLQKNARQLKPIDEIEIPKALLNPADRKYIMQYCNFLCEILLLTDTNLFFIQTTCTSCNKIGRRTNRTAGTATKGLGAIPKSAKA